MEKQAHGVQMEICSVRKFAESSGGSFGNSVAYEFRAIPTQSFVRPVVAAWRVSIEVVELSPNK